METADEVTTTHRYQQYGEGSIPQDSQQLEELGPWTQPWFSCTPQEHQSHTHTHNVNIHTHTLKPVTQPGLPNTKTDYKSLLMIISVGPSDELMDGQAHGARGRPRQTTLTRTHATLAADSPCAQSHTKGMISPLRWTGMNSEVVRSVSQCYVYQVKLTPSDHVMLALTSS